MALAKIRNFEVLTEIGAGRCGKVYKALDTLNQHSVALRVLKPDDCASLPALQSSLRAAASLASPNIGTIHELFLDDGSLVVVMEYVEGHLLRILLSQQGTINRGDLIDFSRQVGMAIDHAKSRGVSHQNLHPGNIVQEWDGALKLMDYGLSANPLAPDSLRYSSPEQARGLEVDSRSNLFSWGAILYEAALGKKAFEGDTAEAVLKNVESASFVAPQLVNPNLHSGICAVISKALSLRPEDRYQTGAELVRELENCTKPAAVKVVPDPPLRAPEVRQPSAQVRVPEPPVFAAPKPVRAPERQAELPPVKPPAPPVFSAARPVPAAPKPAPQQAPPSTPVSRPDPAPTRTLPQTAPPVAAPIDTVPITREAPSAQKPTDNFFVIESKAKIANAPAQPVRTPKPIAKKPQRLGVDELVALAQSRKFIVGASALALIVVLAFVASMVRNHNSEQQAPLPIAQPIATEQAPEVLEASQPDTQPQLADESVQTSVTPRSRKEKKRVVAALPAVTTGELVVDSIPGGASVQIDGRSVGVTPVAVSQVSAGQHLITISLADHAQASRTVEVSAGERANVAFQLSELPANVAIVSVPAGASILVNGKDTGKATPVTLQLPRGHYSVALKKQGFIDSAMAFDAAPGQSIHFSPQLVALANAEDVKEVGKLKRMFGGGSTAGLTKVRIRTTPKGAQIELNQRLLNKTSPTEVFAPPGVYDLKLSLPGYKTIQKRITISGTEASVDESMER